MSKTIFRLDVARTQARVEPSTLCSYPASSLDTNALLLTLLLATTLDCAATANAVQVVVRSPIRGGCIALVSVVHR